MPLSTATQKETMLDLSSVELFGWQKSVLSGKVDRFVGLLSSGIQLPAVSVIDRGEHFSLAYWVDRPDATYVPDGGHHRSVACYIGGLPLRALIIDTPAEEFEYNTDFEIRNIKEIPIL